MPEIVIKIPTHEHRFYHVSSQGGQQLTQIEERKGKNDKRMTSKNNLEIRLIRLIITDQNPLPSFFVSVRHHSRRELISNAILLLD